MAVSTKEFLEVAVLQWPVTVSFEGGWFVLQSPVWGVAVGKDLDAACVEACNRSLEFLRRGYPASSEIHGYTQVTEFLEYVIREGQ